MSTKRPAGQNTPEENTRDQMERQNVAQFITGGELNPQEKLGDRVNGDRPPTGEQPAGGGEQGGEQQQRKQAFEPNVGDDVYYVSPDHGEEDPPSLAKVAHVNDDGTVNLVVFDKFGSASSARNVQLAGSDEKLEGGFARKERGSKFDRKKQQAPAQTQSQPQGEQKTDDKGKPPQGPPPAL